MTKAKVVLIETVEQIAACTSIEQLAQLVATLTPEERNALAHVVYQQCEQLIAK